MSRCHSDSPGLRSTIGLLRRGQHHPRLQPGLQKVGQITGRHHYRRGRTGPAVPPQPRAERPRGELAAKGEAVGRAIPVAVLNHHDAGGGQRQLL